MGAPNARWFDLLLGEGGHFQRGIALAVQGDPEDGLRIGILLGDNGLADIPGQRTAHARNPVADILG